MELADPDRSNPTRPRSERPLDTIRSFEAAIRGTYGLDPNTSATRPRSYAKGESLCLLVTHLLLRYSDISKMNQMDVESREIATLMVHINL